VKCLDVMADHAADMGKKELFSLFRNDEGKFCAGLFRFLQARGAAPTTKIGAFADKVIALPTEGEQVALLIKGSRGWSARSTRSPGGDDHRGEGVLRRHARSARRQYREVQKARPVTRATVV